MSKETLVPVSNVKQMKKVLKLIRNPLNINPIEQFEPNVDNYVVVFNKEKPNLKGLCLIVHTCDIPKDVEILPYQNFISQYKKEIKKANRKELIKVLKSKLQSHKEHIECLESELKALKDVAEKVYKELKFKDSQLLLIKAELDSLKDSDGRYILNSKHLNSIKELILDLFKKSEFGIPKYENPPIPPVKKELPTFLDEVLSNDANEKNSRL